MSNQDSAPSMLHGHVQLAKGVVSEALGYETGAQTKAEGIEEMKAAKSDTPPQAGNLLGSAENAAGKLAGCEGMEKEGAERKELASGGGDVGAAAKLV